MLQVPGDFTNADGQLDKAVVDEISKAVEAATQQAAEEAGCSATTTSTSCFAGSMHYVYDIHMQQLKTANGKNFMKILRNTVQPAILGALLNGAAGRGTCTSLPDLKVDHIWKQRWEVVPDPMFVCLDCNTANNSDDSSMDAPRKRQPATDLSLQWLAQSVGKTTNAQPIHIVTTVTSSPPTRSAPVPEQEVYRAASDGNTLQVKGIGQGPAMVWVHWWHGLPSLGVTTRSRRETSGLDSLLVPVLPARCANQARQYYKDLCADHDEMEAYKRYTTEFTAGWAALVKASRQHASTATSGLAAPHTPPDDTLVTVIAHFLDMLRRNATTMVACLDEANKLMDMCGEEMKECVKQELQRLINGSSTESDDDGGSPQADTNADAYARTTERLKAQQELAGGLPPTQKPPYVTRTHLAMTASWGRHLIEQVAYRNGKKTGDMVVSSGCIPGSFQEHAMVALVTKPMLARLRLSQCQYDMQLIVC